MLSPQASTSTFFLLFVRRHFLTVTCALQSHNNQLVTASQQKSSTDVLNLNVFNIFEHRVSAITKGSAMFDPTRAAASC